MSKDMILQSLMGAGFLVGVAGIFRQLIYNLSLFSLKKPTNHLMIQFFLYGTFVGLFVICSILQKIDF